MTFRRAIEQRQADLQLAIDRLAWIYPFWTALAPYAYVRKEDLVLIIPPNLVYKTNQTGAELIGYLESGGRFEDLPGFSLQRSAEIDAFFLDIKAVYEGRNPQLKQLTYDFDFTRLPVLGEIAVTYRCNNRCRFCYAGCNDDFGMAATSGTEAMSCAGSPTQPLPGNELDTAGFKRIIDIFKTKAKIPFFSFTGGEPLLRPDLEELIAYACTLGLRVNLVSNGTLASAERAASLFAAGLRTAQISLEAPQEDLHDRLCGAPGSFSQTLNGIANLTAAGLQVQTNSTLTALNRTALLAMPAFVKELGLSRMAMNLFIPAGSGLHDNTLRVPYSDVGDFVLAVRRNASELGLEFFWYSPTPLCIFNPISAGLGNKSCAACDGLLSVAPDGSVLPCSSWPEPVGNLMDDSFEAVWFGTAARRLKHKEYAPEQCRGCIYFTACQSACPLYWKHCGYAELEADGLAAWRAARPPSDPTSSDSASISHSPDHGRLIS